MAESNAVSAVIITTSLVAFFSGFALGVYSIRGYLVSPELKSVRDRILNDPVESDESDVDEDDTILDHAPNWANGMEADRRQGLRVGASEAVGGGARKKNKKGKEPKDDAGSDRAGRGGEEEEKDARSAKKEAEALHPKQAAVNPGNNPNEECKLVLVVRTDLGMTKGKGQPPAVFFIRLSNH